jgi:futalosine hydrolase
MKTTETTKHPFDFGICFAAALEGEGLPAIIGGRSVARIKTGVGPVNAAYAVTRFLLENQVGALLICGVGGAYPESGLETESVVCAESECYGDLGADSPEGFLDMKALGFPLIDGPEPIFNQLPLDLFPVSRRVPFVTCATCTGTDAIAASLAARTGGAVESMEGAAVVHVARLMGVKVGEVRGISNTVGNRDRAQWRLREAASAARAAVVEWIENGGEAAAC